MTFSRSLPKTRSTGLTRQRTSRSIERLRGLRSACFSSSETFVTALTGFCSPHYFKTCKISAVAIIKMVCCHQSLIMTLFIMHSRLSMRGQACRMRSWALCRERSWGIHLSLWIPLLCQFREQKLELTPRMKRTSTWSSILRRANGYVPRHYNLLRYLIHR